ncbi:MAG TPA: hypothetical protein HPQ04_14990 [Rhodospirillaceae bacterium]|nr:hypothetical protein [Rhodospirillaceae bacterium]
MNDAGEEVLFELRRVGNVVKASAIHVSTNIEVSIVGPANASQYALKMAALRKLRYVLKRQP